MNTSGRGQPERMRPLRRDAELNRQRILRAAAEVFGERGFDVTLDDVAHHAGVGVGTVYRRFPSKQALAEALFVDKLDAVTAIAEKALENPDSWSALAGFLEDTAALQAADRGLREIVTSATYSTPRIDEARSRLQRVVPKLLDRAREEGIVRADLEPSDLALIQFMLTAAADYAGHVRPQIWRRYLALILDGLRPSRLETSTLPEAALTSDDMRLAHLALAVAKPEQQRPGDPG